MPPPSGTRVTDMGWEIAPDAFRSVMIEAKERYAGDLPIYILENGAAFPDRVEPDGRIRDQAASAICAAILGAVQDAIASRRAGAGLFRLVVDGQFRVDARLQQALRSGPCRL